MKEKANEEPPNTNPMNGRIRPLQTERVKEAINNSRDTFVIEEIGWPTDHSVCNH
jgi:exo-beta-1,3-glucanase (GH17 family)